ncbi:unnamed protein product [Soboliphyme baturini]|uniref:CUB domain-containing protein n=1 Tax=Soboliphyme baturini TaxID=241478 RepID=A0A183IE27_9BILA|nr:unnamed protein product [Soboliphyme baturini]
MTVIFRSDRTVNFVGFEAVYMAVNESIHCDRTFNNQAGFITNLGYPQTTSRVMTCEYHLRMKTGYKIVLSEFNLTLPCRAGYLEVR